MQIHVSRDAAALIRRRGGRLFLWQRPVGRGGTRDCLSLDGPPADLQFECHSVDDVQVCFGGMPTPADVVIRRRRRPFRGVRVYVNGKRWGWRGDAVAGG